MKYTASEAIDNERIKKYIIRGVYRHTPSVTYKEGSFTDDERAIIISLCYRLNIRCNYKFKLLYIQFQSSSLIFK